MVRLLAQLEHNEPIAYPDIATKAKAQEYIGLLMEKLKADKKTFLETVIPVWDKTAQEREKSYETTNLRQ